MLFKEDKTMKEYLKEIFKNDGYYITPYGPEGTSYLLPDLHLGLIKTPFYHWTHDPIETFNSLIGSEEFKFIYLHRDPRDAAVSWAHDLMLDDKHKNEFFQKILESVVTHNQPIHLRAAVKWVNSDCKIIRFDQIKEDIFKIEENEIYSYLKFDTEEKIIFKQFEINDKLHQYINDVLKVKENRIEKFRTLQEYYSTMKNKKNIIKEIKNNLI